MVDFRLINNNQQFILPYLIFYDECDNNLNIKNYIKCLNHVYYFIIVTDSFIPEKIIKIIINNIGPFRTIQHKSKYFKITNKDLLFQLL